MQLDDVDDGNTAAAIAPRRQRASRRTDIEVSLDETEKGRRRLRRLFFDKKRETLNNAADASPQDTAARDEQLSTSYIMSKSLENHDNQCRNDTESNSMIDGGSPLPHQTSQSEEPISDYNPIVTSLAYPADNDKIVGDGDDDYCDSSNLTTYVAFSVVDHDSCSSLTSCSREHDEDMFSISSRDEGGGELLSYEEQRRIFQDVEPYDEDEGKVDPFVAAIGSMISPMAWWKDSSKKYKEDKKSKKQKRKSKEDDGRRRNREMRKRSQLAHASGECHEEEEDDKEEENDDAQDDNNDLGEKQRRSAARRQMRLQTRGNALPGAYPEVDIDDEYDDDVEQGGYEAMPANTLLSGNINGINTTVIIPFAAEIAPEMEDIIAERDSLRMELEDSRQRLEQEQQQRRRKYNENNDESSSLSVLPVLVESVPVIVDDKTNPKGWHGNELNHNAKATSTKCPCCTRTFCCRTMIPIVLVAAVTFYVGNRIL